MPALAPFGVHQYWRVYALNNNGGTSYIQIAQVEFLDASGNLIAPSGGTVIFSSEVISNEAVYAFDGTPLANSWLGNGTTNQWIGYQFPAAKAVASVRLWTAGGTIDRAPKDCILQSSNDGSTWVDAFSFSYYYPVISTARTFPLATPAAGYHYAWRLFCADNNGGSTWIIINEIEFHSTIGGADITSSAASYTGDTTGRVIYSSFDGSGDAYLAFSGTSGQWLSAGTTNQWIGQAFPNPVAIAEIAVTSANGQASRAPQNMKLEYSDDGGSTWTAQKTFAAQTAWGSTGETRVLAAI